MVYMNLWLEGGLWFEAREMFKNYNASMHYLQIAKNATKGQRETLQVQLDECQ